MCGVKGKNCIQVTLCMELIDELTKFSDLYIYCTVVANKTGPTCVADFRAMFTAERPYLFLGPETTYAVEQ